MSANNSGQWFFQSGTLAADDYVVTVQATDITGNVSTLSSGYDISIIPSVTETPVVTGISNDSGTYGYGITNDPTPVIAGTATAGSFVRVQIGEGEPFDIAVSQTGEWSFEHSLGEGIFASTAYEVDLAGNLSVSAVTFSYTVDLTVPDAPSIMFLSEDTGPDGDGIDRVRRNRHHRGYGSSRYADARQLQH